MKLRPHRSAADVARAAALAALVALAAACGSIERRTMEVTAYSDDPISCNWTRGSWVYLKLDVWNRYVASGPREGRPYDGRTASGVFPREPRPGLLSGDSLRRPWMIVVRLVLPWRIFPRPGTLAADTDYYPFGTEIHVPGWGWGVVEDRGSAIKGPARLDVFYDSRRRALEWGRQNVDVSIAR